jgi:hypothetical protein
VELQGHAWEATSGGEAGAAPGGESQLWLLWQVLWLMPDDTHFSVHILDNQGQLWAQRDTVGYPTAYRGKGDRVVSRFDITSIQDAPPGPHWARVGQYLYPQLVTVPVIDGAGNPTASSVMLGPLGGER